MPFFSTASFSPSFASFPNPKTADVCLVELPAFLPPPEVEQEVRSRFKINANVGSENSKVDGYLLIFQRLEPALKSIVDRNDFMHEETFA